MTASSTSTGTLTVNTQFALGLDTNTTAAPTKARFNLLGGTANINTNMVATTNDSDSGNLFQLTIDGGTLDMLNHNIGSATQVSIIAASGVLKNTAQINNGAGFTYYPGTWARWTTSIVDFDGDGKSDVLLLDPASGFWYQGLSTVPSTFSYTSGTFR